MTTHNSFDLIFGKDDKNIHCGEESIFTKRYWENWMFIYRRMILDLNLPL